MSSAAPTLPPVEPRMSRGRLLAATLVVGMGVTLSTLTASIVFVSLPSLAEAFSVELATVQWTVMAYFIGVSSLHLSVGRIADLFGRRRVYQLGFIIFIVASLLSGLSPSVGFLIAARVLQAVGASIIQANGPAIMTYVYPAEERGRALGYFGIFGAIGFFTGPIAGGLILSFADWPWVFYALIPVAGAALIAGAFVLPAIPAVKGGRFDRPGAILIAFIFAPTVYALNSGFDAGWTSPLVLLAIVVAATSVVLFIIRERATLHPLVDLKLFKVIDFRTAVIVSLLGYISIDSVNLLMPFFMQRVMATSPATVGLVLASIPVVTGLIGVLAGYLSDRIGSRLPRSVGLLILAGGLASFALLGPSSSILQVLVGMILVGLGRGFFVTPNTSVMMGSLPRERLGLAGGFVAASRTFGRACGQALWGGVFGMVVVSISGLAVSESPVEALLSGYRIAFLAAAGVALLATAISLTRGAARGV
jgi:EmrB/QacA subfamily drug resistance transporter